jgi:mono/diheme cytochrome c family protein
VAAVFAQRREPCELLAMIRIAFLAAAVGTLAYAGVQPRGASLASQPRTTWDGVFSDSQAARGDTLYKNACARCHGATLAGTDSAAELTGRSFLGNWDGLTLDQLYDKIYTSMPPENPKSIPRGQIADILAYVLSQNKFPAGKDPLGDSADQLKEITLLKSQP